MAGGAGAAAVAHDENLLPGKPGLMQPLNSSLNGLLVNSIQRNLETSSK
jgi:hypothetical protein